MEVRRTNAAYAGKPRSIGWPFPIAFLLTRSTSYLCSVAARPGPRRSRVRDKAPIFLGTDVLRRPRLNRELLRLPLAPLRDPCVLQLSVVHHVCPPFRRFIDVQTRAGGAFGSTLGEVFGEEDCDGGFTQRCNQAVEYILGCLTLAPCSPSFDLREHTSVKRRSRIHSRETLESRKNVAGIIL
ncbi:hypothetical protein BD410DRAFT_115035 [Rickenella mellea]|uniref:Uncharacterized protein n=1 Tax=Rickenella mellea TaxID=50990 RepID=A0A4Y7Q9I6_9AGAM|nr:hypothetical protein BD410DRAFT_115035 [Rickenella mellea]